MIDGAQDETWFPTLEDAEVERFKWAWNAVAGELVWAVSGPGDGLPSHTEQLSSEWGREPRPRAGDVLGAAEYVPPRGTEAGVVLIQAFYGKRVPPLVADWFRAAFPDAELRG